MVKTVLELTAPLGTTTVTPAAGMLSVPPLEPMVLLTVMGEASGEVRWSPATGINAPTRPPRRLGDAAGGAATGDEGAVVGSPEQAAITDTTAARNPMRRRVLFMMRGTVRGIAALK